MRDLREPVYEPPERRDGRGAVLGFLIAEALQARRRRHVVERSGGDGGDRQRGRAARLLDEVLATPQPQITDCASLLTRAMSIQQMSSTKVGVMMTSSQAIRMTAVRAMRSPSRLSNWSATWNRA